MSELDLLTDRLRAAQAAINAALIAIEAQRGDEAVVVGTCVICEKPIYKGEFPIPRRGAHSRCVALAKDRVKSGEWSQEFVDSQLLPPAKGGRKPKQLAIDKAAQQSIAERASNDVDKKLKRLGATKKAHKKESD